jgi:chemotaxis protein MotA
MDLATLLGLVLSFGLVLGGILTGSSILLFVDLPSMLIVAGGSLGATLVQHRLSKVLGMLTVIKHTFLTDPQSPTDVLDRFMDYVNRARRDGLLSLEPLLREMDDPFLRKGLQLTVDGVEPAQIQDILECEIANLEQRHEMGNEVLSSLAAFSPAMGLIGTVIGLIQMLHTMSDPGTIGPAMAVALNTTFYGAILANLVFSPMAGKLRNRTKEEVLVKEMILEGVVAIARGENPRIVEEKLGSFLPPRLRRAEA